MIREGQQIVKRVITIKRKNLFKKVYEPLKNTVRTPFRKSVRIIIHIIIQLILMQN